VVAVAEFLAQRRDHPGNVGRWIVQLDRRAPLIGSLTQRDRDPPFKRSDPGAIPGRPTNLARHAQIAVRPPCKREK
jgi:hypothetical protein